jgi:hypothetical protein
VAPWESIRVPHNVEGSSGIFRAPKYLCALEADNDWLAINAWLDRHKAAETRRAYRREAERLLLWAIVERGKALSSLASVDATAYRAFLGHPAPRVCWVGPAIIPRVAAVRGRDIAGFHRLFTVSASRHVPLAD